MFEEKITNFKSHLLQRGYPEDLINTILSEVNFRDRKLALQRKQKRNLRILPSVTQYQPSVLDLKQILMKNWHLIEQQPLLSEIYNNPPFISYKREGSSKTYSCVGSCVGLSTPFYAKLYRETCGIKYFYGIRDQNLQQFWDQG